MSEFPHTSQLAYPRHAATPGDLRARALARSGCPRGRPRHDARRGRRRRARARPRQRKGSDDDAPSRGLPFRAHHPIWRPGLAAPTAGELAALRIVEGAAQLSAIRVFVSVYPAGSRTTPLTAVDQADFASYTAALVRALPSFDDVIVGNEPNLNRFWLPQYGPGGENVAAPAYLSLLAQSYDAVKGPTQRCGSGVARSLPAASTSRTRAAIRTRRPNSSPTSMASGRVGANNGSWTASPSIPTARTRARAADVRPPELQLDRNRGLPEARRPRRTGFRRHRTTWIDASDPLRGVVSRPSSRRGKAHLYTGAEPATTSRSTKRRRPRATRRRSSSRSASRPCPVSSSSMPRTRPRSAHGSQASSTPTGRRRRANRSSATHSSLRGTARSPAAPVSSCPSHRRRSATRHAPRSEGRLARAAALQSRLHLLGAAPQAAGGVDHPREAGIRARRPVGDRRSRARPGRPWLVLLHDFTDPPGQPGRRVNAARSGLLQLP